MGQRRDHDGERHAKLLQVLEQPNARLRRFDLPNRDQKVVAGLRQLKKIFFPTNQWEVHERRIQDLFFVNDATDSEPAVHFDDVDAGAAMLAPADQNQIFFYIHMDVSGAYYAGIRHIIERADPKGCP